MTTYRDYGWRFIYPIGEEQGVSRRSVVNVENKALKKLRINPELKRWHDEIIATHSFRNTGFESWGA